MAAAYQFHAPVTEWLKRSFKRPTEAQRLAWPKIQAQENTLLLAPTGSGKTLAAFLVAIDRLSFGEVSDIHPLEVLYVSPLKALGADVERNLRSPIAGIRVLSEQLGYKSRPISVGIRSGDTPAAERRRLISHPPHILITTPESLFLMLTSQAREILRGIRLVIIDEIHAIAGTKRGVHFFVSLERLQRLVPHPIQRIGLSATQRPLEEVARLLGGGYLEDDIWKPRAVSIVDARSAKKLSLGVEMPSAPKVVEHQAQEAEEPDLFWPKIHQRIVELIRTHRCTMIFVNSRRLAERLAQALNDIAQEDITRAHHGSLAKEERKLIEDQLKRGQLPALVATSSMELGIDMGAVELVIQVGAPPSVASGLQRVGRAGHTVGQTSKGILFPKFRGELVSSAAAVKAMLSGVPEATYYPRNALDVLAQQVVAILAEGSINRLEIFELIRQAAPYAELELDQFDGVLDMLSGKYPSHEFSEFKPRIHWDRFEDILEPRKGTQRLAVLNAGTIPDRGLFGVYLAEGIEDKARRVGELDEEMVFETQAGDVFILGASSWKVLDITHDKVIVVPAPGEPGRMPFWRGDRLGRPFDFGVEIGALLRQLSVWTYQEAFAALTGRNYALSAEAANILYQYIQDQLEVAQSVPTDRNIIIERFVDEIGDWRICILGVFGTPVFAPWATVVTSRLRHTYGDEVDVSWSDDGIIFRIPEGQNPPSAEDFIPSIEDLDEVLVAELPKTSLFAAYFRENSARALLLPRKMPGKRRALWAQRRKSADLLSASSKYSDFPMLLETFRTCFQEVFDLDSLRHVLQCVQRREISIDLIDLDKPSPFASTVLYDYIGNFVYSQDTPLAERKAQVLSIDYAALTALLGEGELRSLFEPDLIEELMVELQSLRPEDKFTDSDDILDLLRRLGERTHSELLARVISEQQLLGWLDELLKRRRILEIMVANEKMYIAIEDAALYRDSLGVALPPGLPEAFLEAAKEPMENLFARYAKYRTPFTAKQLASRYGLGIASAEKGLSNLVGRSELLEGAFLPGGTEKEYCARIVYKRLKQKALSRLRRSIEPVEPQAYARFLLDWQAISTPRRGSEALLDTLEQLQGCPLHVSELETMILPSRVHDYGRTMLDELFFSGQIIWRGVEPVGEHDGRVAFYFRDIYAEFADPVKQTWDGVHAKIVEALTKKGALFFNDLVRSVGGFGQDIYKALWKLVWDGVVSNDSFAPMRSKFALKQKKSRVAQRHGRLRSVGQPGSEGRWTLLPQIVKGSDDGPRSLLTAQQLLWRHGILGKSSLTAERITGGFSSIYPVLRVMEETHRASRGYFVNQLGGAQFADKQAAERLRRNSDESAGVFVMAASDPANPYGQALAWPKTGTPYQRGCGCKVLVARGTLVGFVNRAGDRLWIEDIDKSDQEQLGPKLSELLYSMVEDGQLARLVKTISDKSVTSSWLKTYLNQAGFSLDQRGMSLRKFTKSAPVSP